MSDELFLRLADYFFLVFHTLLILFNFFGWIWKPLRKWHLVTILLTFASWGILGIWYGLGYCPLTDWHWEVLRQLGVYDLPNSYISYLLERWIGLKLGEDLVDALTLGFALLALAASLWTNLYSRKKRA